MKFNKTLITIPTSILLFSTTLIAPASAEPIDKETWTQKLEAEHTEFLDKRKKATKIERLDSGDGETVELYATQNKNGSFTITLLSDNQVVYRERCISKKKSKNKCWRQSPLTTKKWVSIPVKDASIDDAIPDLENLDPANPDFDSISNLDYDSGNNSFSYETEINNIQGTIMMQYKGSTLTINITTNVGTRTEIDIDVDAKPTKVKKPAKKNRIDLPSMGN